MFDRTTRVNVQQAPAYPQEVTHKLAPTAEHMRLLEEFRREALESVMQATAVKHNKLGDILIYKDMATRAVRGAFILDGELISFDTRGLDDKAIRLQANAHAAREIARKLLSEAIHAALAEEPR